MAPCIVDMTPTQEASPLSDCCISMHCVSLGAGRWALVKEAVHYEHLSNG